MCGSFFVVVYIVLVIVCIYMFVEHAFGEGAACSSSSSFFGSHVCYLYL